MRQLIPPNLDSVKIYQDIKDKSRTEKKTRMENLEAYVTERYDEYFSVKERLENIGLSNISVKEDKDALISCYSRSKEGYLEGEVVAKIISVQQIQHKQKCPYCGMDKPRTIDHYLPKSDFPEFAIYPPNLIPCCGYCNMKKKVNWIDNGERVYLNLYYDNIPSDIQYLFFHLEYEGEDPSPTVHFSLENFGEIDDKLFRRIKNHYTNLNLLEEFSQNVEEELSKIVDQIHYYPNITIDEHKANLERDYNTSVRKYGINFWRSSFLGSIMQSDTFFEKSYSQSA